MEIPITDLDSIETLGYAAHYAGVEGAVADLAIYRDEVFRAWGVTNTTKVIENTLTNVIVVITPATDTAAAVTRPLLFGDTGFVLYLARIPRCKLGLQPSSSTPATPPSAPVSSTGVRKIKLSHILSQLDHIDFNIVSEPEEIRPYARYETLYGKLQRLLPNYEPTTQQRSDLKILLDGAQAPFADFALALGLEPSCGRVCWVLLNPPIESCHSHGRRF
eukprot:s251_g31.t1